MVWSVDDVKRREAKVVERRLPTVGEDLSKMWQGQVYGEGECVYAPSFQHGARIPVEA